MASNFKRHRAPSHTSSSSSSSTSTTDTQQPSKASRPLPSSAPLLCTLPPTCTHRPTPLANTRDLETHYATYHAHVCAEPGCAAVFPDARLLELHQTECHDPLAAVRKDRGEKIFACHLPSCARRFLTPKARRLHLIHAHAYPKEYFFAVTNKGVGGLLKRWGEGASLIRGEWSARDPDDEESDGPPIDIDPPSGDTHEEAPADQSVDTLVDGMGSLNLVPPSIRFGRGGRKGGFLPGRGGSRGRGGRGRGRGGSAAVDVDGGAQTRTLGPAGRGRAGIVRVPGGAGREQT